MPNSCAFIVIIAAKRLSLPPIFSANATAMSLAECTAIACMASSTVIWSPGCRPSLVGGCEAASGETVIRSVSRRRPVERASNARYSVMILVIDAG